MPLGRWGCGCRFTRFGMDMGVADIGDDPRRLQLAGLCACQLIVGRGAELCGKRI